MEVFKIVGFAIIATVLIIVVKDQRPEIAILLTSVSVIAIMMYAISKLSGVIEMLDTLINSSGMNKEFLTIILKVTGIAYIVEFGKNVCADAGQTAIATKLEMAGKVIIVTLSLPLINALLTVVSELI
ncbi:MAG: SpoIIIAC/SpoIIIAD family protein [Clostridia bacterium]|nr:SpoIIIAC/SpoIIIAD family protein [Clostridia bacterium]